MNKSGNVKAYIYFHSKPKHQQQIHMQDMAN